MDSASRRDFMKVFGISIASLILTRCDRFTPLITCYAPMPPPTVTPTEVAARGSVDPETLSKAQAAIERDMAFYELSDEEIQDLYSPLMEQARDQGSALPAFEALPLEPTPDARTAARFILHA